MKERERTFVAPMCPLPLTSMRQITRALHCSADDVRKWAAQGGPILVTGEGGARRYTAEYNRLFDWLLLQRQ